ncbi:EPIDERMAL PATTERNING FACTOR-like protein 2 [Hibiscus syriacus]|uniref:Epidermal patterning factor-like protein n=1 Tax=Hibiscus syriacus TaxID=106335 RepID=A0A6A3AMB9_HIBSY|nr:EPIDERMAL PATTERNING FACTOR-like protein 2 [Hibiscus syriacus]KAE8704089.1 EPIDERMAL PATTERNING FACTOR-like protein 2 [Hibiscus syriacus]
MVRSHCFILCRRHCRFFLIFLLILSSIQVGYQVEGRPNPKSDSFSKAVNEEKEILRGRIGSRPPRCKRRCSSCGHCEAIQVPIDPQLRNGNKNISKLNFDAAYTRGVDNSNYKPMSWKCRCGNFIFNP